MAGCKGPECPLGLDHHRLQHLRAALYAPHHVEGGAEVSEVGGEGFQKHQGAQGALMLALAGLGFEAGDQGGGVHR